MHALSDRSSPMKRMEWICNKVAQDAFERVMMFVKAMMASGEPFMMERLTTEQKLLAFQKLETTPNAWYNWVTNVNSQMEQTVSDIAPEERAKLNLTTDIVKQMSIEMASQYRFGMLKLGAKNAQTVPGLLPASSLPPTPMMAPPQAMPSDAGAYDGGPVRPV